MKAISIALLSAFSLTASAVQINKARDYNSAAAMPSTPSFTVETVTSDGNTQHNHSSNGKVDLSFNPSSGVFLTHAELQNEDPAESATCVARDSMGNQVRAFGGPSSGNVDAVDFMARVGQQIYSLSCGPVS